MTISLKSRGLMNDTFRKDDSAFITVYSFFISICKHVASGDNLYTYQTVFFLKNIYYS